MTKSEILITNDHEKLQDIQEKANNDLKTISEETISTWLEVLNILSRKIKKPSFETWIKPNFLFDIKDEFAFISVRNDFTRNFLLQSFAKPIQQALKEVTGKALALNFIIENKIENPYLDLEDNTVEESTQIKIADLEKPKTNQNISGFSFKNLVKADFNVSAINFSKAIIENSTGMYKSLFLFSQSGLGKTHILQACLNEVKTRDSQAKVKYINAEKFTNELIIAIQRNETQRFRQNYRTLDFLFFDDFQFLDNKKSCQDELAYTFETLLNNGAKFLISSAKKIDEFKLLRPKLKSIIQASLVANLERPKQEDRRSLIQEKSKQYNLSLTEDHLELLSQKPVETIREIEGFLLQLSAEVNLNHLNVSEELINESFGGLYNDFSNLGLSLEKISKTVSEYFSIDEKDLKGQKRSKEFTNARHIAIYLSYELLELSYSRIGDHYSGRKHSSIIHSIKTVKDILNSRLPSSKATHKILEEIRHNLSAI